MEIDVGAGSVEPDACRWWHPSVLNIAKAMQERLDKEDCSSSPELLCLQLQEKVGELLEISKQAIQCNRRLSPSKLKLQHVRLMAADVAGHARMIAVGAYDETKEG